MPIERGTRDHELAKPNAMNFNFESEYMKIQIFELRKKQ